MISWRGLVNDSLSEERFQIVEKATVSTGEVTEWFQRVVTGLNEEFEMRMRSIHIIVE